MKYAKLPQSLLGLLGLLIILPMLLTSVADVIIAFITVMAPYAIGAVVLFLVLKLGVAHSRRW